MIETPLRPFATLAYYTVIEARRSGLPWLAGACIAVALGLAAFLSQVAVTESLQLQAALVAASLRACAVFLVAMHVVTSIVRENADKGFELVLSLPVSRTSFYAGKLAGHISVGVAIATVFALPLLIWAGPGAVLAWWLSLVFEVSLAAALSLFFVITLANVVPALSAITGFYLLARSITAMQAIAVGPVVEDSLLSRVAKWGVDGVALLLPRLDTATRTDWVVYGAPSAPELAQVLVSLALYAMLACAAGLVDFHRRNLRQACAMNGR
jgi:hypothetical protein